METEKKVLIVPDNFFSNLNKMLEERNRPKHEKFVKFLNDWVAEHAPGLEKLKE